MPLYLGETQIEGLMVKGEGGGGSPVIEELDVAAAGTYAAGSGVDGYSPVVVPAGTAGTPTASKGNVSNNSVQVTPSVTNSAGFIAGGTKNGTPVTVSASELVSGKKEITSNGDDIDVTNFEKVKVAVSASGGTAGTGSATLSAAGNSISFTGLNGTPKAWFIRCTTQLSSSGSTTYYYVADARYNGTNTQATLFRIGSTRRIQNQTSGISYTYSGGTLTVTTTATAATAAPGYFYNGTYELTYVY